MLFDELGVVALSVVPGSPVFVLTPGVGYEVGAMPIWYGVTAQTGGGRRGPPVRSRSAAVDIMGAVGIGATGILLVGAGGVVGCVTRGGAGTRCKSAPPSPGRPPPPDPSDARP